MIKKFNFFLNESLHKYEKCKKIISKEIDPFDEEHCGYIQEQIRHTFPLSINHNEVYSIRIRNKTEYDTLMNLLEEYKYIWRDNSLPTSIPWDPNIAYVTLIYGHISCDWDKNLKEHDRHIQPRRTFIDDVRDVEGIILPEKIRNIKVDPFNEEDWGY